MFATIYASASRFVFSTDSRSVTRSASSYRRFPRQNYRGFPADRCACYWENMGLSSKVSKMTFSEWNKLMVSEKRASMTALEIDKQTWLLKTTKMYPKFQDIYKRNLSKQKY